MDDDMKVFPVAEATRDLRDAAKQLDRAKRNLRIVIGFVDEGATMTAIAQREGITRERVRQVLGKYGLTVSGRRKATRITQP